ncbi:hypothetical protein Ac2012v2_006500 [Leucoagaricus gongylophorus]
MGLFSKKSRKEDHNETSHYSPLTQSESYSEPAGYNHPGYASHQGPPSGAYNTSGTHNNGPAEGYGQQQQYKYSNSAYGQGGPDYGSQPVGSSGYQQFGTGLGYGSSRGRNDQGQVSSEKDRYGMSSDHERTQQGYGEPQYGSAEKYTDSYVSGGQGYGGGYFDNMHGGSRRGGE